MACQLRSSEREASISLGAFLDRLRIGRRALTYSVLRFVARHRAHQRKERHPDPVYVHGSEDRDFSASTSARGYFVSTVGKDEGVIRRYIREQEAEDERVETAA